MRGDWTARLNGRPLAKWRQAGDFVRCHSLAGCARPGINRLEFRFTLRRATDGMIGACRLEGNVIVRPGGALETTPARRATATAATTRTALGLPFYCGPVRYWQRFNLKAKPGGRVRLRCPGISGNGAAVRVNGVPCGSVRWAPDEVDVTAAVRRGANLLEIDWRGSPVTLTGRVDPSRLGCRVQLVARRAFSHHDET